MRTLTALSLAAALLIPRDSLAGTESNKPGDGQDAIVIECVIVIVVVITAGYALYEIKHWCDKHLGTTNNPPKIHSGITNNVPAMTLFHPSMSPAPITLQSATNMASPWQNCYTFTYNYLGMNIGKVACWSNGIYIDERTAPVTNGQICVVFNDLLTGTNPQTIFRLMTQ